MGNGRSRYEGDFPSNVSASGPVEERMNDNFSWTLSGWEKRGLVTLRQQGVTSEGWMIDRDLKWNRDTHLLSHHANSHSVCNFGTGMDLMKKDCALFLILACFFFPSVLMSCTQPLSLQTISLLTKCTNEMSPLTAGSENWCARTFFPPSTLFELFFPALFCTPLPSIFPDIWTLEMTSCPCLFLTVFLTVFQYFGSKTRLSCTKCQNYHSASMSSH